MTTDLQLLRILPCPKDGKSETQPMKQDPTLGDEKAGAFESLKE